MAAPEPSSIEIVAVERPAAGLPADMKDEDLVLLARLGEVWASNELIVRHFRWVCALVGYYARRERLQRHDREDAQQNAVFAIVKAIRTFDPVQPAGPRRCSFRTFLRLVVTAHFKNFVRDLRRSARRRGQAQYPDLVASVEATRRSDGQLAPCSLRETASDPALVAQAQEFTARLEQALSELDPDAQWLWSQIAQDVPLKQVAAEAGISYSVAKRRLKKIRAQLWLRLKEFAA